MLSLPSCPSLSSLSPWNLLHCSWPQEGCTLMNSRQILILFLSHAKILCTMNLCPSSFFLLFFSTSTVVHLQLAKQCHNSLPNASVCSLIQPSLHLFGSGLLVPSTVNPLHHWWETPEHVCGCVLLDCIIF